jgi:hypothetical protein
LLPVAILPTERKVNMVSRIHATLVPSKTVATEVTPLLSTSDQVSVKQSNEEVLELHRPQEHHNVDDDDAPLPRLQVALLCYVRMVEPVAFFSIFPFLNKMILETGNIKESDVGFYSGWIVRYVRPHSVVLTLSNGPFQAAFNSVGKAQ